MLFGLHVSVKFTMLSLQFEEQAAGALILISSVHLLLPSTMVYVLSPPEILKFPRLYSLPYSKTPVIPVME